MAQDPTIILLAARSEVAIAVAEVIRGDGER